MDPPIFRHLYLVGMLGTCAVRLPGFRTAARDMKKEDIRFPRQKIEREGILITIVMLLWFFALQALPIVYTLTGWFEFADIRQPAWMGFAGFGLLIFAVWMLWSAHHDLGKNWSSTVQIRLAQALGTQGIYKTIRNPIYTAHILCGQAQVFMMPIWLVGWGVLKLALLVFALPIPNKEKP